MPKLDFSQLLREPEEEFLSLDEESRRGEQHRCTYCGRFVKHIHVTNYYNGQFDCMSGLWDCSKCGPGMSEEYV